MKLFVGAVIGAIGFGQLLVQTKSKPWHIGYNTALKEACVLGYAEKVIDKDDKVIYRWKEQSK